MELFFFCACGGGRLLCEERRLAPAARGMTGTQNMSFLAVPGYSVYNGYGVYKGLCTLVSKARKRPIASTGRLGNCIPLLRRFALRARSAGGIAVSQPDTHGEAAG